MTKQQLDYLFKILDLVLLAAKVVPEIKMDYDVAKAKLKQLLEEDRNPTDLEWKDLEDKIDSLNDRLNTNKALGA